MEKLAKFCDHCGKTGLEPAGGWDPKSGFQPPCRACNGTKYVLTVPGEDLRKFVVALLGDDDVREEFLKFVQIVRRDIREIGT
jgi:hypothetical protein